MKRPSGDRQVIGNHPILESSSVKERQNEVEVSKPQVKGTLMLGAVMGLRSARSVLNVPTALLPYLSMKIELMEWYPEEHLQQILAVLADAADGPRHEALVAFGRTSADVHSTDLYKNAFEPNSPFLAGVLWSAQHDTGEVRLTQSDDTMQIVLSNYEAASEEICTAIGGYLEMACLKAGIAVHPAAERSCRRHGDETCEWTLAKVNSPSGSTAGK